MNTTIDREVKFDSDEAKAKAIEGFDESKGSAEDLERIMKSPVEKTTAKADETPQVTEKQPDIPEKVTPEKVDTTPQPGDDNFDWKAFVKEKGFKTVGEYRKAFDEAQSYIKDRLGNPDKRYEEAITKTRELQTQLDTLLKKGQQPEQREAIQSSAPATQQQIQHTEDKIEQLRSGIADLQKRKRDLNAKRRGDPALSMDEDFMKESDAIDDRNMELNAMIVDEMKNLRTLHTEANKQAKEAIDQVTNYSKNQEQEKTLELKKKKYEGEMEEITNFTKSHKEFSFSEGKDSKKVETEYIKWANMVASAYFGQPVDMRKTQQSHEAVLNVMSLLSQNDPDVLKACSLVNVQVKPTVDIEKYLDICDMLDRRDGYFLNPVTGSKEQQFRLMPDGNGGFSKQPVIFKTIEDAYQHKMAVDGTFSKKIKEAYSKGGKDIIDAMQKRTGATELNNAIGSSAADAGLEMDESKALDIINKIDEREALRKKISGDSKDYDALMGAQETLSNIVKKR